MEAGPTEIVIAIVIVERASGMHKSVKSPPKISQAQQKFGMKAENLIALHNVEPWEPHCRSGQGIEVGVKGETGKKRLAVAD